MDPDVTRLLEFDKVARILAAYTVTSRGRAEAERLRPLDDAHAVHHALQETTELVAAFAEGYTLPLGPVEDVSAAAERARAGGAPLEPQVFWRIAECLAMAGRVAGSLQRVGSRYPALLTLGHTIPECPELVKQIRSTVEAAGIVQDGASPQLKAIRQRVRSLRRRIEERLNRMVRSPNVRPHLQYEQPTMCRDRYVLPVNAYRRTEVRGIVHGSSDSGATLYVEPMEIVEFGNDLSEAIGEEDEEVLRVLWELTRAVGAEADDIVRAAGQLAEVDVLRAKAVMSAAFDMCEPDTAAATLELRQARHPLLLYLTRPEDRPAPRREQLGFGEVVPLDVHLDGDFRMLVITGPNTGGKTVVLKTAGIICLMARAGMHVPATKARVPLYDRVYADIGDEQSLEQSLSTFSSHMSRIIDVLAHATRRSLVLLDELGAGTDPTEGSALGEAILDRLLKRECSAIVVTHLGRLKTFAVSRSQVENASMDFDMQTLRPTYHLTMGTIGSSNALEIAERLGLPPAILAEAGGLLDRESDGEYSTFLDEVRLVREDAEERRSRMQYLEQEAARLKEEYEKALVRLKAEEERRGADMGLKMRDKLQALYDESVRLHEDMRYSHKSLARRVRTVRNGLKECLDSLSDLLRGHRIDRKLKAGDEVYVIKVHKWGTVERVDRKGERARVRVGSTQIEVDMADLQPWGESL